MNEEVRPWAGIGLAVSEPRTVVVGSHERTGIICTGGRREEARSYAETVFNSLEVNDGIRLDVLQAPPKHVGLGSTTQLALSVGTAVLSAYGKAIEVKRLALSLGRGRRSWIGIGSFEGGGFILDMGADRETGYHEYRRFTFPVDWCIVLAYREDRGNVDERTENVILDRLTYDPGIADRLERIVTERMIPGILEKDISSFGVSLSEVQRIVGSVFSPYQGGVITPQSSSVCHAMERRGLVGVGQSSWGSAVYGFTDDSELAESVKDVISRFFPEFRVSVVRADNRGAVIEEGFERDRCEQL